MVKVTLAQVEAMEIEFHNAIRATDIAGLKVLCERGFRFEHYPARNLLSNSLYGAIASSRWELGHFLQEEAARQGWSLERNDKNRPAHQTRTSRSNLWRALSDRDNPALGEKIMELGGRIEDALEEMVGSGYPHLTAWMIENYPAEAAAAVQQVCARGDLTDWINVGRLAGSGKIRAFVSLHAMIDPSDPCGLAARYPRALTEAWAHLAERGNIEVMAELIRDGWGPGPLLEKKALPLPWSMAINQQWRALEWWLSVPALKEDFHAHARAQPGTWWNLFPPRANILKDLDRLQELGLDVTIPDASGKTLAHYWMDDMHPSRPAVDWLLRTAPGLILQPDKSGRTPLAYLSSKEHDQKVKQYVEGRLLKRSVKKAVAPTSRARM